MFLKRIFTVTLAFALLLESRTTEQKHRGTHPDPDFSTFALCQSHLFFSPQVRQMHLYAPYWPIVLLSLGHMTDASDSSWAGAALTAIRPLRTRQINRLAQFLRHPLFKNRSRSAQGARFDFDALIDYLKDFTYRSVVRKIPLLIQLLKAPPDEAAYRLYRLSDESLARVANLNRRDWAVAFMKTVALLKQKEASASALKTNLLKRNAQLRARYKAFHEAHPKARTMGMAQLFLRGKDLPVTNLKKIEALINRREKRSSSSRRPPPRTIKTAS